MLPQMQQAAVMNPNVQQQMQEISQKIEARKAILIADMTEEFMKEEKEITSQFDHDPLLKLKPLTSTPVIILTPKASTLEAREYIALVWFEYPPFFS